MRHSFLLLLLTVLFVTCSQEEPVDPTCEVPLDCQNGGEWVGADSFEDSCECQCEPGYCGETCETEILDCQNGGTWNDSTCECECPTAWQGEDCSEFVFDESTSSYINFTAYSILNGVEELIYGDYCLQELEVGDCELGDGDWSWYSGDGQAELNVFIAFNPELLPGEYVTSTDDGIQIFLVDFRPEFNLNHYSTLEGGTIQVIDASPYTDVTFESILLEQTTQLDSVRVVGEMHYLPE